MAAHMVVSAVMLLVPVAAVLIYIGCDLTVINGKASQGKNVITTADNIMFAPPLNDDTLVSASTSTYSAGSTVTLTFGNTFRRGIAHATAGTFTAPQFSASANAAATTCTGTNTIKYKNAIDATSSITWTAPGDVSAVSSVTLSFAGAARFGAVSRHTVTLTRQTTNFLSTMTATTTMVVSGGNGTSTTTFGSASTIGGSTMSGAIGSASFSAKAIILGLMGALIALNGQ